MYDADISCDFVIVDIRWACRTFNIAASSRYQAVFCKKMELLLVDISTDPVNGAGACEYKFDGILIRQIYGCDSPTAKGKRQCIAFE